MGTHRHNQPAVTSFRTTSSKSIIMAKITGIALLALVAVASAIEVKNCQRRGTMVRINNVKVPKVLTMRPGTQLSASFDISSRIPIKEFTVTFSYAKKVFGWEVPVPCQLI